VTSMNRVTPVAQISAGRPLKGLPDQISGAKKYLVPVSLESSSFYPSKILDTPKSAIFKQSVESMSKLSGFMSL